MPLLTRRHFTGCLCCSAAAVLAGCTTTGGGTTPQTLAPTIQPGHRPAAPDEANIWYVMERTESHLKQSPFLVRDPELNTYVRDIACRLAGSYCPDLRVYILRTPYFNASMAPNGMMQVWSGLLVRCRSEAQLAAVLGHEIGHYVRQHTLERIRDVRAKADLATFLSLGMAAAGVGAFAPLAQLALVASIYSFSRDQEREADAFGIKAMTEAGYAPVEASRVWEQVVKEQDAAEHKEPAPTLTATHPAPSERIETLKAAAADLPAGDSRADAYRERLQAHRPWMLSDQLKLRQFGRTEVVLDSLIEDNRDLGFLHFYRGELYRARAGDGDDVKARAAYERALSESDAPAEAHRGLGLLHRKAGDGVAAQAAFRRYLELRPDAPDGAMIRTYLGAGT